MNRRTSNQPDLIRTNPQQNSGGFTIIELMIATMVFSIILLLVTTGILQIGKSYYRGVLQSRTQATARNIIDEISRGIQFSGETVKQTAALSVPYPNPGSKYAFCINGIGYAYVLDRQLVSSTPNSDQANRVLVSFTASCNTFGTPSLPDVASVAGGKELLGIGMRLTNLNVVDNGNNTFTITIGIASGERDLFNPNPPALSSSCKTTTGSQFCAVSKLSTTVQKRVK